MWWMKAPAGRIWHILRQVLREAGCKILLAQKAFSMFAVYPLIGEYLAGTTASGLFEAKLGKEEMGGETHIFSAAYVEEEFEEILQVCDHISFNSFAQWKKYRERALKAGKSCSIRINPEHSTQEHGIYDPCAAGSRLGVTRKNFQPEELDGHRRTSFPHPVRAEQRCAGGDGTGSGREIRPLPPSDEMGEFWRRPPYHPAGL